MSPKRITKTSTLFYVETHFPFKANYNFKRIKNWLSWKISLVKIQKTAGGKNFHCKHIPKAYNIFVWLWIELISIDFQPFFSLISKYQLVILRYVSLLNSSFHLFCHLKMHCVLEHILSMWIFSASVTSHPFLILTAPFYLMWTGTLGVLEVANHIMQGGRLNIKWKTINHISINLSQYTFKMSSIKK